MAMTATGFKDWAKKNHRVRFVMNGESADKLIDEMFPVFEKLNATPAELEEASLYLWLEIASKETVFWDRHCGILRDRIIKMRRKRDEEEVRKKNRSATGPTLDFAEHRRRQLAAKMTVPEEEKFCPKCKNSTPVSKLKRTWCDTCCAEFDLIKKKG